MQWSEVYTNEPCKRCDGTGVTDVSLSEYGEAFFHTCQSCEGRGREIDLVKLSIYMDEKEFKRK